jgi:hypothetical protein
VADLLLITDIPRLKKVFLQLAEERNLPLRVAGSLEKGAEEIVADKPAMVFVQTHLSGLSADILLMHLKKLLGRRRTRFVLLSPNDQVSDSVIKLYNNYIDTSLDDKPLLDAINATVDVLAPKGKKAGVAPLNKRDAAAVQDRKEVIEPLHEGSPSIVAGNIGEVSLPEPASPEAELEVAAPEDASEPSLEEQGVVYTPRPRMSVYSEFTSTFDSAVNDISETEVPEAPLPEQVDTWKDVRTETIETEPLRLRSKRATFLLWFVPLVAVVVGITLWQHRGSQPKPIDLAPVSPLMPAGKPASAVPSPGEPAKTYAPAAQVIRDGAVKPQAGGGDGRLSDKAVLSAIAENRINKEQSTPASAVPQPTALPGFIPRGGLDKEYGTANPGWERYKGVVTEFKVFREGAAIKAIQIIDRGGQGIPEIFMKNVLGQLAKTPSFVQISLEKKEGYEIQRGQVSGNLSTVFYRDAKGGKLRAFVVTWQ